MRFIDGFWRTLAGGLRAIGCKRAAARLNAWNDRNLPAIDDVRGICVAVVGIWGPAHEWEMDELYGERVCKRCGRLVTEKRLPVLCLPTGGLDG